MIKIPFWRRWRRKKNAVMTSTEQNGVIMPRSQHGLSRRNISKNALRVLTRLHQTGFAAHLVGGGVRDVLLNLQPKDFDVATSASPQEVRRLFRNSRIIGRRFLINHVYYYNEIIEVSTFRGNTAAAHQPAMLAADNTYGTIEEDAWRRDFTVNALYYNIADFSIIDYTGGMDDLNNRLLRMIGEPQQRCHEDPVRLLRAMRLAAKLNFTIHPDIEKALYTLHHLLAHVPPARLFDEFIKLFFKGHAAASFIKLQQYGYMNLLFPSISQSLQESAKPLLHLAMQATDQRFHNNQSLNPGFLLAVILWPAVQYTIDQQKALYPRLSQGLHHAIEAVFTEQNKRLAIPKRLSGMMRAIWLLQYNLSRRRKSRVLRILQHRYFRAALDLFQLRVDAGENLAELASWWNQLRAANAVEQQAMLEKIS